VTENFDNLSDFDFERLVADLLSAEWRVHVESFPRGRDGGVDLRVLGPANAPLNLKKDDELVVQCKHRPGATYSDLKGELKKEAQKGVVDEAVRYVVATSARLTRANKKSITETFGDRVAESDVLAREDIAALIRRHPQVEKATPKLWMSTGPVLATLLHKLEYLRSGYLREELLRLQYKFVETKFTTAARACVEDFGVCILAGPPGVGKTTTAHILLLQLMADGWEPIVGVGDVRELEAQITPGVRQVLFFDDFLGQNSLEAKLRTGGDAELLRLIQAVEQDPNKIFIMTTRDYVLRQAQQSYEKLSDPVFSATRVTVRADSLSLQEKSHILYNQLYFSPLRSFAAAAPGSEYVKVACHRKFNPRLTATAISLLVRETRLSPARRNSTSIRPEPPRGSAPEDSNSDMALSPHVDIPTHLIRALERPEDLWDHSLRYQLSELQRDILFVRASFGQRSVLLSEVYTSVRALHKRTGRRYLEVELDSAVSVLDGDFLSLHLEWGQQSISARSLDPGLADAVAKFLRRYPELVHGIVETTPYFTQVLWIAALCGYFEKDLPADGYFKPRLSHLESAVLRAAERTLLKPGPTEVDGTLFPVELPWHRGIGQRLDLLLPLYRKTDAAPRDGLIDEMTTQLLSNLPAVRSDDLLWAASSLRSEVVPAEWRPTRTRFEVGLLDYLGEPNDMDDWSRLKDVIDVVPVTDEFFSDLETRFAGFASDLIDELKDLLENEPQGDESDIFEQLADLASALDFDIDTQDIEELLEEKESESDGATAPSRPVWSPVRQTTGHGAELSPARLFDLL
jgi:DNA polymerase III delta prime subunit